MPAQNDFRSVLKMIQKAERSASATNALARGGDASARRIDGCLHAQQENGVGETPPRADILSAVYALLQ